MKKLISILTIILFTTTIANAGQNDNTITLKTINNKTIHILGNDKGFIIPEYKGKIMFVEFWGTHCPPCLMSIPHYIDLTKKYGKDIAILAIEVQDTSKDRLKAFVAAKGINYDIVDYRTGYYFVQYIAQRAQWKGSIPLLLILDQKGVVQIIQPGLIPENQLETVIKSMIKKAKSTSSKPSKEQNKTTKPKQTA